MSVEQATKAVMAVKGTSLISIALSYCVVSLLSSVGVATNYCLRVVSLLSNVGVAIY